MIGGKAAFPKDSDHYRLLERFVTFEQVSGLKRAIEVLREFHLTNVSRELLAEGRLGISSAVVRRRCNI